MACWDARVQCSVASGFIFPRHFSFCSTFKKNLENFHDRQNINSVIYFTRAGAPPSPPPLPQISMIPWFHDSMADSCDSWGLRRDSESWQTPRPDPSQWKRRKAVCRLRERWQSSNARTYTIHNANTYLCSSSLSSWSEEAVASWGVDILENFWMIYAQYYLLSRAAWPFLPLSPNGAINHSDLLNATTLSLD